MNYVYLITDRALNFVKVGVSKHPLKRLKDLERVTPFDLEIMCKFRFENDSQAYKEETRIHQQLYHKRVYFDSKFDGSTEWFILDDETCEFLSRYINRNTERTEQRHRLFPDDIEVMRKGRARTRARVIRRAHVSFNNGYRHPTKRIRNYIPSSFPVNRR